MTFVFMADYEKQFDFHFPQLRLCQTRIVVVLLYPVAQKQMTLYNGLDIVAVCNYYITKVDFFDRTNICD